jgi:hypothetical protein
LFVVVVAGLQEHPCRGVADCGEQRVDRGQRSGVAGLGALGPPRGDAVVQRELDVDGVVDRVRVDQRVTALMNLVAVGEPHADPHRRVQRRVLQHAAGIKAQAQVVRADLAAAGHGQPVVARARISLSTAP